MTVKLLGLKGVDVIWAINDGPPQRDVYRVNKNEDILALKYKLDPAPNGVLAVEIVYSTGHTVCSYAAGAWKQVNTIWEFEGEEVEGTEAEKVVDEAVDEAEAFKKHSEIIYTVGSEEEPFEDV